MIKKIVAVVLFLALNSFQLIGQVNLIREGIIINNTETGTWYGDNIPRSVPTKLTYRNNSITSVNTDGYLVQAGDDWVGSTNNNLDGAIVTGNKLTWNGENGPSVITHGLLVGYNINSTVKYNYLDKVPYGIIFKSGTDAGENMTFTSGGCAYNICKDVKFGVRIKGINGVKVYNNTFYNGDGSGWYFILITENMDQPAGSPSTGSKIFNNIFYSTTQIPMIKMESGCFAGFECDYNVYWCTAGEPTFMIDGVQTTWAQWRALGYDAHSVIADPRFINTTNLAPNGRLDYGKNLGTEWQSGLSTTAAWLVGTSPSTINQNGTWQVGASIYLSENIPVNTITISGATTITTDKGTLQLTASVLPDNATNKAVTWTLINGTGQATINSTGLVTAITDGTVTARATTQDGSDVSGTLIITISNQVILVSSVSITGTGGASTITTDKGTLQLTTSVLPDNATNKAVTWSLVNGTGQATISATGLVTAINDGTVTARATAQDGSDVSGTMVITISNQVILVSSVTVTASGGASTITTDKGTLQLTAFVLPDNATNKTITWTLINGTGHATISATGLVTAVKNGTVATIATAKDGSGISGTLVITISNQITLVSSIRVTGTSGATTITKDKGTLQLTASVLPDNATNKAVTWTLVNGTGQATISATGLVTAVKNGTVTARATAQDGSGISGTFEITISNQIILVTSVTVTASGGITTITQDKGTLQLNAIVQPDNATNKSVNWTLSKSAEQANISTTGLVTAVYNGTITARALANDESGVSGTLIITISNQVILSDGINGDEKDNNSITIIASRDKIKIMLNNSFLAYKAYLYNIQGVLISGKVVDSDIVIFNTSGLPPGIYFVVLSNGRDFRSEKVIKP